VIVSSCITGIDGILPMQTLEKLKLTRGVYHAQQMMPHWAKYRRLPSSVNFYDTQTFAMVYRFKKNAVNKEITKIYVIYISILKSFVR